MQGENITCFFVTDISIACNGTVYEVYVPKLTYKNELFWIYLGVYVALVLLAGLMSGLTMGLLSLDLLSLQVLQDGGTPKQQKYATRILPVVKRHHLLLVTLLLANAAAVESMPLFLDRVSDPVTAICVSVTAVLLFGEVFPQALCTRFGLAIGATLIPLVYFLMGLLFVIAWPISKLLDLLLGKDHTTFFRRAELKALVDLHGPKSHAETDQPESVNDDKLTIDEVLIIKGALEMKNKTVQTAMVPLESVFMLNVEDRMDTGTMSKVLAESHSRIPIYDGNHSNILGILLVKLLIKLDPDDGIPIRQLLETKAFRKVPFVYDTMPLYDLLNEFQTGKGHLSIVKKANPSNMENASDAIIQLNEPSTSQEVIGIITLEDVIEELIQEEILDETDVFIDVHKKIQVARAKVIRSTSLDQKHSKVTKKAQTSGSSNYNQGAAQDSHDIDEEGDGDRSGVLVDVDIHSNDDQTPLLSDH